MATTCESGNLSSSTLQQPARQPMCKSCLCHRSKQTSSWELLNNCAVNIPQLLSDIKECVRKQLTLLHRPIHYASSDFQFLTLPAIMAFCHTFLVIRDSDRLVNSSHQYFLVINSELIHVFIIYLYLFKSLLRGLKRESCNERCDRRLTIRDKLETEPTETKINRILEKQDAINPTLRRTSSLPCLEQKTNPAQEPLRSNDVQEMTPVGQTAISCQFPAQTGGQSLPGNSLKTSADRTFDTDTKRDSQHSQSFSILRSSELRLPVVKQQTGLAATLKTTRARGKALSQHAFAEMLELSRNTLSRSREQRNPRSGGEKQKGKLHQTDAEDDTRATARDENVILKELVSAPTMRFADGVCRQLYFAARGEEEQREESVRLASFYKTQQNIPSSGVWIIQLAAAGFYCPQEGSSIVRCAFCDIRIELSRFVNIDPAVLHRRESPNCPLMTGRAVNNVSFQQRGQEAGLRWLQSLPGATGTGSSDRRRLTSEQREKENGKEGAAVGDTSDRKSQTSPQPSPHLQSLPASAGQIYSPKASVSQAQPQVTSASQPQSVALSPSKDSSTSRSLSLPSPTPSAPTTSQPPPPPPTTTPPHSAASVPLAGQVLTDVPHREEPTPAAVRSTETRSSNQNATGQNVDTSRSAPFSRPTGSLPTDGQLPYQTAQFLGPAEHQEPDRRSSDTLEQSRNSGSATGGSTQSATSGTASAPVPDPAAEPPSRQLVTYLQLGIHTEEPRRPDFAISTLRVNTFNDPNHPWPHPDTHKPEDMAQAGFYYIGREDTVRCFHCKGGLKTWANSPDPWVEHARYFPQCPFVCQVKGQQFVDAVQALKGTRDPITAEDVKEELQRRQRETPANVNKAAITLPEDPVDDAEGMELGAEGWTEDADEKKLSEIADELENENQEMASTRVCKICQVNDVSILFLPCGHLISCADCSPALRTCAICRQRVKGRVRVEHRTSD